MIRAVFGVCSSVDIETIDIAKVNVLDSPQYSVCVYFDENPKFLLNIYLDSEPDIFHELVCSDGSVFIGCGNKVHVFNVFTKEVTSIELEGYFGHLYPVDDPKSDSISEAVLVASAINMIYLSPLGEVVWCSPDLAIDGVVVYEISDGVVIGSGEFDPPGGWEEFRLDLKTGAVI